MNVALRTSLLVTLCLGACTAAFAIASAEAPGPIALVGGTIYPDPVGPPTFDGVVLLSGGKIAAVGPRDAVPVPAGATVIECHGAVVLAGFQNSHVHFTEEKWAEAAHQDPGRLAGMLTAMLTRYGFTTVVDTASFLENTSALRRRIDSGEVQGPRILTAGEALYPPNGIPYYLRGAMAPEQLARLRTPATAADAVAEVRRGGAGGADVLKLFTGSWVERGKVLPMPGDIAAAAAAEAHRQKRLVFAHESNVAGLRVALDAGVDVLAHAIDDSRGITPRDRERMRRQKIAIVPTLKLFSAARYLFDVLDEIRDFSRSGGQILFGTDVGYLTDYDPTEEYALMSAAGLGWREILASLTTGPAERFGEQNRRGRLAPGLDADIVVLDADPVRDVRAFADVRYAFRAGRLAYSRPRP
ncbi:MAG: amidohydrolase family protein [Acidobacteriota bacterium]|nr:amidohydrolase family protein [Acidobacteriota bacterium]